MHMVEDVDVYEDAARETVEIGNRIAEHDKEADLWDIADGLLAGAIHYWLYSRQPCDDPGCDDCSVLATAEDRIRELKRLIDVYAQDSEYYHSPRDTNVGRA